MRQEISGLKSRITALKEAKNAVLRDDSKEIDWETIGKASGVRYALSPLPLLSPSSPTAPVACMCFASWFFVISNCRVRVSAEPLMVTIEGTL